MRDLTDFLQHVTPFAPSCPEPAAVKFLREAAQEFCSRTRLWRETVTFTATDDLELSVLGLPMDSAIHEIEAATFDGEALQPVPYETTFGRESDSGPPKWITQAGPDRVSLIPAAAGTLVMSLFLKPTEDAETVPDMLFDHYAKVIGWGALREIKLLPNQPFTDMQGAGLFSQRFEDAINRRFASQIVGQHRARRQTTANFF